MLRSRSAVALIAVSIVLPSAAWAQSSPSANQIIDALKPGAQSLRGPTRGIRPIAPQAASPQAASPEAMPAGVGEATVSHPHASRPKQAVAATAPKPARTGDADGPAINLFIQFANDSAELTPAGLRALDELGKALSSNDLATYHFRIEGHTDTIGSKGYNKALSERRAAAVAEYLASKYGVSQNRLVTVGMGSDHLLIPTPEQTPEARNRRVQIVNIGA